MREILKLSQEIIGQIAAGEVVERPAAAIKELVENSIDAGAKNITVEIREGGIRYFRVSDNGCGIPPEQIRMAFERHATSKIISADDLYHIDTLGFRGEALASIAAVAKVTCTTRTAKQEFGTCAIVEAGRFLEIKEAASPIGTSIVVEHLFQNTPVRLKFLKKPAYEAAAVADYMMRLIMSRPDVGFRFVNEGKTVYRSNGDGKLENAIFCVYGGDTLKLLQPVHGHMSGLLLDGFVGVDELSKGNRNHQSFYINDRYFQNLELSRALEEGCKGRVMIGKFPMCVLKLRLPTNTIDVNVHPNKLEIRFQNAKAICDAAEAIVMNAFAGNTLKNAMTKSADTAETSNGNANHTITAFEQPQASAELSKAEQAAAPLLEKDTLQDEHSIPAAYVNQEQNTAKQEKPIVYYQALNTASAQAVKPPEKLRETAVVYQVKPVIDSEKVLLPLVSPSNETKTENKKTIIAGKEKELDQLPVLAPEENANRLNENPKYIGTLFHTYLIFEHQNRVLLVDQHAAHEKILFDRYMKQYNTDIYSQNLLCPKLVRLSASEILQQGEWIPPLREAGFLIEPFDEHCVSVYGIPYILDMLETPEVLLHEAINEWQMGKRNPNSESLRTRIAQMACKHAIKGGDVLNRTELEGFIHQILNSETEPYCPHGRPIVIEISQRDLEKKFKRIQ